jgi:small conductance mechanosensitive channel
VNIGYQERILIVNETLQPTLPAEPAAVPTEAVMEFRQLPFAEATEKIFSEVTEGKFELVPQYAVAHLGSGILMAMVGLGVLFVGYLIAKYVSRLVSTPICRRVDETLGRFSGRVVFYGIMFGVAGAVLSKMGTPLGGLAAMLAAAGFAIGLAFQGTLSNFAAGVLMLVFRPFKVGDLINAGGVLGKVNEIDLFTTTLDTPDNRRIIVPNSSISGGTIENVTYHKHRRIEVLVGVAYSADMDQTRASLQAAVDHQSRWMIPGVDRGSKIVLANLGASAVEWQLKLWVDTENYATAMEELTCEVKRQLDFANIPIAFPQLDIHLNSPIGGVADSTTTSTRQRPIRRESFNVARAS